MTKISLEQAILKAKAHSKKGNFEEAKQVYQSVLQAFPKNKRAQKGLADLNKSTRISASAIVSPEAINQVLNLYNQGQLLAVVDQANLLIKRYPKAFDVWNILGAAYKGLNRVDEALNAFRKVTELNPTYADGFNNLGVALKDQGKLDEAVEAYNKALSINSFDAELYSNLANALNDQSKLDEALLMIEKSIALDAENELAHNVKGTIFYKQGKLDEGIESYRKVLAINPNSPEAYNNIGVAFQGLGNLEIAFKSFEKALTLKPDFVNALNNIGKACQYLGKSEEAIQYFNEALSLDPDHADAHLNRCFIYLKTNKIREGLNDFEWRWRSKEFKSKARIFSKPVWDGHKHLKGKTILIWGEQGPQDMIIWSSCLPYLKELSCHCILECSEKLLPLFSRSFPDVHVRVQNEDETNEPNDFDFHLPMGSLFKYFMPQIFQKTTSKPFLMVDPLKVKKWRERLKSLGRGPYVGISWKSPVVTPQRSQNYTKISDWEPVLSKTDVTYINLQSTDFQRDIKNMEKQFGSVVHNFDELNHYDCLDDVAALCVALDVCISVSTAVAAISAGVGTRTKLILWAQSDWSNKLLMPTGPKVDIFERNTWETWAEPFAKIAKDLCQIKVSLRS
jgi:tetratricopeptide (TPR) repeat protein